MEPHPYGWLSLLPPLIAIGLAIVTRKATLSLLVGLFCGALITTNGKLFLAVHDTCEVHLWPTFTDPDKLRVFSFTLLMGAMIGVICCSGGMQGMIRLLSPFAKTRRGGQLVTWLLGLLIFFDDYANTILLGGSLRPLCDRLKISREKLAYLVDTTAAPVASLSLLSTWVAVEIEYVREGIETLGAATQWKAIDLFVGSIPYRFYVLMSLVFIPMIALTGRDFGPMLKAERRRLRQPLEDFNGTQSLPEFAGRDAPARWYNAVLPIVVTLGVVVWLLYTTGRSSLEVAGVPDPSLRDILGSAKSSFALQYGALVGLILAVVLARIQRLVSASAIVTAAGQGARIVLPALAILWCASALSRMTGSRSVEGMPTTTPYEFKDHRLYTGDFLAQKLLASQENDTRDSAGGSPGIMVKLFPTIVFILAAVLSFATGTSYGTMGILLPIVVTLAHALLGMQGERIAATNPILLASVGSVLAGAVFGDHCSPISDTTILSSQSCVCDHISHVVTQFPYALLVAIVIVIFGTLPLGWGVSVWLLLPLQVVVLYFVLNTAGQNVEQFHNDQ
jgi:Na+/H+ antiporter NhaC